MKSQRQNEIEEENKYATTHVSFGVRSDALGFFKRMTNWFYEARLINELSLLARGCTNIWHTSTQSRKRSTWQSTFRGTNEQTDASGSITEEACCKPELELACCGRFSRNNARHTFNLIMPVFDAFHDRYQPSFLTSTTRA